MTSKIFRAAAVRSALAFLLLVLALPALAQNEPRVDFETQVRPVLAAYCYECHGSNRAARESDLRLDQKQFAFADLGGYHAIVPGEPPRASCTCG